MQHNTGDSDNREAMVRWQDIAREQRSSVNSLFLTYAAGLLAFQASILLDGANSKIDRPCIFEIAGGAAALSLMVGCAVVLVRLRNFRLTARLARCRFKREEQSKIEELRKSSGRLDDATNVLIPIQVCVFGVSAFAFVAWLLMTNSGKLSG
jgi:hypothetical protein